MKPWGKKLYHFAEFICATMLATIFIVFIVQIVARYVLNNPFGWTIELCAVLWVWVVFFGNAFIVRDKDQVKFDILYLNSRKKTRQIMALIAAGAVALIMLYALYPTWDSINFLKIRSTSLLKIPFNWFYSIYLVFMVSIIIRYGLRFVNIWRNGPPDDDHVLVDYDPEPPAIETGEEAV